MKRQLLERKRLDGYFCKLRTVNKAGGRQGENSQINLLSPQSRFQDSQSQVGWAGRDVEIHD